MSSLSSNGQSNPTNHVQADQSTPNTLRKDPSSRPAPVSSKLVKSRVGAADSEPSTDVQHQQQGPMSRTNRLRKALGVSGSSNVGVDPNGDPKYAAAAFSSNRKQSGSKASPSTSPTLAKHALPPTTTTEPVQSTVSRPPALRSQSYSKRHASFDTPREVPMPSIPAGASSIDPIALDDSDMERNQAAAGRKHAPRQPQPGSRYTDTSRKPTNQPSSSFRRASAAAPSSSDNSARDKLHIDLANEAHGHAPSLARNNSAPTPPHTPSAERMDLRYPQPNDTNTPDSGTSGSGSEQTSPALDSDNVEVPGGGYPDADTMARAAEQRKKIESMNDDSRNRADVIFKEGRLSTASLPLPRSYGAERVSLLPPPVRPSTKNGNGSGSGSGSDGGQQAKTPTNFASTPNATIGELDLSKVSNANSSTAYRTSYPFAGSFARDVPLIPGPRESSLTADVEKNTQAGTAWRSSGPFMRREYNEEDSEEKSAISRGQFTKQPEIEAPAAPLHPLLDPSNLTTPSASNRAFNFGPSSTTATPGHEQSSPDATTLHRPALSALTPSEGGAKGSPAPSADRTSTASGSSGASSELPTFSERSGSSFVLPKGPAASNDNSSKSPEVLPRPRPTTEPIPSVSTSSPTMTVDTTPSAYILEAFLPGYQRDEITLSTRKKRILHVVADGFVSGGGHFERRVSFGYDADMSRVRAEFNGSTLKITVPRRPTPQTFAASLGTSATVGGGSSSGVGGTGMFWRGRSNVL